MKELQSPTLIVICGWPVSGKSTIAKIVSEQLKVHWVDIDDVRRIALGLPHPHPDSSPELMERDRLEMGGSYQLLIQAAEIHLRWKRSVIITATFSRKSYQEALEALAKRFPHVLLRVIWCLPTNDPQEEIERRLQRGFGKKYVGAVNSWNRYLEVKNRFQEIELPHCKIDTSPPHTTEESAQEACDYILQPHP